MLLLDFFRALFLRFRRSERLRDGKARKHQDTETGLFASAAKPSPHGLILGAIKPKKVHKELPPCLFVPFHENRGHL